MFTQLEPQVPLHVVDRGAGIAIGVIDYGPDWDLLWVVAMNDGGEIWCVPNAKVRAVVNYSTGRRAVATPLPEGPAADAG